jgi:ankyrin repeat protein
VLEYLGRYFDVFITDDKGRTPLFYAAVADQLACCALLISMGQSGYAHTYNTHTPTLQRRLCCCGGVSKEEVCLRSMCYTNRLKRADPPHRAGCEWVDVGDARGDTPLHAACCNDALKVCVATCHATAA